MQTCCPPSPPRRLLPLLLTASVAALAGCVVNPGVAPPPEHREAAPPPELPPELATDRRLPLLFPDAWRGLRRGEPLAGCPAFDPADYRSDGPWPDPRLTDEDGLHRDVLACTVFDGPRDVSLAWVVPPERAHEHGLCHASPGVRAAFAADPDNWVYAPERVLASGRRERGPGDWLPTRNACWYVRAHLRILTRYGLSIRPEDAEAIDRILELCGDQGQTPAC